MIYIIDTYAWIEYFSNSKKGIVLKDLFESQKDKFVTMECCIAELKGYCLKNNLDFRKAYSVVRSNSVVLPVMFDQWVSAAEIKFELRKSIQHFGLIDAILVAKQKELKCRVVSGDPHFRSLSNVVYIGE